MGAETEADFSGYATRAGVKCTDGRTIRPNAFKGQHGTKVPLVWHHGHGTPDNVLGHAFLENRSDGVYAYAFFNNTPKAQAARELVRHGDITQMSIWANHLVERNSIVHSGIINEVSLVLKGANSGATIDNVSIKHGSGDIETLEDEAIIFFGDHFEHSDGEGDEDEDDEDGEGEVSHAAGDNETVQSIYDSMNEKQKLVTQYMIGAALEQASADAQHSDDEDGLEHKEGTSMRKNIFEKNGGGAAEDTESEHVLSHADFVGLVKTADDKRTSLKATLQDYALSHGIDNIDILFPDAQAVSATPEWIKRRTEWVAGVLNGTRHTPFSRIKSLTADLTMDEARAKGYIKGNLKKEQFFSVSKRITTPTTIYKKQKFDRDDIVDITEFDVIAWVKGEMRLQLEEELATAILIGDGREADDEDKINESCIRPILTDDELFVTTVNVNIGDANSSYYEVVEQILRNRRYYKGTGTPTFYTTEATKVEMLLSKDAYGRRYFTTEAELASALMVTSVVAVETMERVPDLVGILVNLTDYNVGADKGGEVNMFDDFDIDYNQLKYLIETRCSGALVKAKSALVVKATTGTNVLATPSVPTFVSSTGVVTIPSVTGVVYKDAANATLTAGAQTALAAGASTTVHAEPASGYYFTNSVVDGPWTFTRDAA